MKFTPLSADCLVSLGSRADWLGHGVTEHLAWELAGAPGWACVDETGAIAAGGVFPLREGCGHAWMMLSRRWRRYANAITTKVITGLAVDDHPRVEAVVRCDNARAHKWIVKLGFELEAQRMRRWGPDGLDYALYARVK